MIREPVPAPGLRTYRSPPPTPQPLTPATRLAVRITGALMALGFAVIGAALYGRM